MPCASHRGGLGFDERTVADWWARLGRQGQAVHEYLVEQPRDLGQVQADELRVKKQGGIVWMALAMMVKTRLWPGGEVSEGSCWNVFNFQSYISMGVSPT